MLTSPLDGERARRRYGADELSVEEDGVTASVVSSSCRLTIVSSAMRVDLAVPVQITAAELVALVVQSLGREAADQGAAEGGWVLQRGAEAPLDPSTSLAAAQVRDGDVLYLRTRADQLPEVAFDDVLDAVASGVVTRTPRWLPVHTARAAALLAAAALLFGLAVLLFVGPGWLPTAATSGAAAVLLTLTAVAIGRVFDQRAAAVTCGGFAVAYAAVCGGTAVAGQHRLVDFGAPQILVAAGAAVLVGAVLVVSLGDGLGGFVAVVTSGLLTAIGTAVASGTTLSPAGTAAVVAAAALAVSPLLPTLAFRLSRLPLPAIPTDAADLRRDPGTLDARSVLAHAVRADQYLTGLVGGVALAIAGAAVVASAHGVSERVLAAVLGVICLLRARLFTGRSQRALLLVSGSAALVAVAVAGVLSAHGLVRTVGFAAPAVVVAVVLFALAVGLPGRRYAPPVSRAADVVESLLVLSVIPLALAVMGVYGAVRTLTATN